MAGPRSPTRSSAWIGPVDRPSERAASAAVRTAAASVPPGSREGLTSRVSSNVGPSGVAGLSKTAVTVRSPAASTPSMLSSGPGRYSSMSRGSAAGRSASSRTLRIRRAASTAAAGSSARSTPWLALRDTALTTHGNPTASAACRTQSWAGTRRKDGWGRPAAAQRCRWAALSVAARTASTGLCGRPIRAATVAASTSIGVSAATTASTGPARARIRRVLASRSAGRTGMTGRPPSGSAPSLATTRSRPIRSAARMKSAAR